MHPTIAVRLTAAGIPFRSFAADRHGLDSDASGGSASVLHDVLELADADGVKWDASVRAIQAQHITTFTEAVRVQLPILIGHSGPDVDAHIEAVIAWWNAARAAGTAANLDDMPRWQ